MSKEIIKSIEKPELHRRGLVEPDTLDDKTRSVEVVFASEEPVLTIDWSISDRSDGLYYEILSCDPSHVRMDRINNGAPVLDSHNRYTITQQLGVVEKDSAKIGNGQGTARIRFSKREDADKVYQDVKDQILQNISCGYRIYKAMQIPSPNDSEIPTYKIIDWEPKEISLTPVQADGNARIREEKEVTNKVEILKLRTMPEVEKPVVEVETPPTTPAAPETPPTDGNRAEQVMTAERTRATTILEEVRTAKLDLSFGEKLIKDGTPIDQARSLIIKEFAKGDPNTGGQANVHVKKDEADTFRLRMETALSIRSNGETGFKPEEVDAAREFRVLPLVELARAALEFKGEKTAGLSARELSTRALAIADFPVILANTINRTLRMAYEESPRTFQAFCRRGNLKDFRDVYRAQLSSVPDLSLIGEGGEYPYGKMADTKESYKLAKYGQIISLNWETLVNDDLDAFSRVPVSLAAAAARKQSDIVYGILTGTPTMADTYALFEAAHHANYAASGTTIAAGIAAAKSAMRKQRGLAADGTKTNAPYLNLEPKYLIVGPDKETEAISLMNLAFYPSSGGTVTMENIWKGALEVIVDPRITGNAWYLSAEPRRIDTIEYGFLDGEQELFTERRLGFDVDGLEIKVRMVFAAKAIDHRGLYKNVGA